MSYFYLLLLLLIPKVRWALFGNDEDTIWGDLTWNPSRSKDISYAIGWWVRNPFHNFTWHVIGIVGKEFDRFGRYPKDVFSPIGWNYAVIKYKWLYLPFISYIGWCKFYIGWREKGNFGIKLTSNKTAP